MRAKRIIDGASFGPEVLKVVCEAYDQAWVAIAEHFAPEDQEMAREVLAGAMMSLAREDAADTDIARLRNAGIRAMQAKYPSRFDVPPQEGQGTKIG